MEPVLETVGRPRWARHPRFGAALDQEVLGRWEQKVSFCGGQKDIVDQVSFKSLVFSVTVSHCLIPLYNLYSPITTSHIKESQATSGRVAESQQHADRRVNSSSLTGFLLLQAAILMQRSQPAESAFKVKCTARPRTGGPCPEGLSTGAFLWRPERSVLWPCPCTQQHLTTERPWSPCCCKYQLKVDEQAPAQSEANRC